MTLGDREAAFTNNTPPVAIAVSYRGLAPLNETETQRFSSCQRVFFLGIANSVVRRSKN